MRESYQIPSLRIRQQDLRIANSSLSLNLSLSSNSNLFNGASEVEADVMAKRLEICLGCERNKEGKCSLCARCGGRPVKQKVRWNYESCPLKLWTKIDS